MDELQFKRRSKSPEAICHEATRTVPQGWRMNPVPAAPRLTLVVEPELLEMPVLSYRITERPLASFWASKDSQFATDVIVEPLNPPLAGRFAGLET